jgi:N-acetylglucosamine-6-sulfatase
MNLLLTVLLLATLAVAKQPNILFVLTDDQGKYVGGLEHMPKLQVVLSIRIT